MAKQYKDIKESITDAVIHNIQTSKSKKSSVSIVATNVRYIDKIILNKISK